MAFIFLHIIIKILFAREILINTLNNLSIYCNSFVKTVIIQIHYMLENICLFALVMVVIVVMVVMVVMVDMVDMVVMLGF